MYKSKLQELCQQWRWPLPEYNTTKEGPQHLPRFSATVNVNGHTFFTPAQHKSAKEAQNNAAHVAVYHLTSLSAQVTSNYAVNYPPQAVNPNQALNYSGHQVPNEGYQMANTQLMPQYPVACGGPVMPISPSPSELPIPTFPSPVLVPKTEVPRSNLSDGVIAQQNFGNIVQTPTLSGSSLQVQKGKLHIYKTLLQEYAQKKAIPLPVYDTKTEGPGHASRFKSKVSVDGRSYETQESFTALKEAEQAVAKVACEALSLSMVQGDDVSYKNLLQELALRKGLDHPSYKTTTFGPPHKPEFVSQVELGSLLFQGGEGKTKKQAEMNAAKVAYDALVDGSQPEKLSIPSSICDGTTQPANSSKLSSIDQSASVRDGILKIEERASTRKQTDIFIEEAQLQSKKVRTSSESMNPAMVHGDVGEAKSTELVVVVPPTNIDPPARTIIIPQKTTLVTPESSSTTILPISDDQWAAYKVELNQNPGTTA